MNDKMQIICNQITALETILTKLANRPVNKDLTVKQYQDYLKINMEGLALTVLDNIRFLGQKMEAGLVRRKKFLEMHNLEDKYQEFKK